MASLPQLLGPSLREPRAAANSAFVIATLARRAFRQMG
jgi:hypothetical protein